MKLVINTVTFLYSIIKNMIFPLMLNIVLILFLAHRLEYNFKSYAENNFVSIHAQFNLKCKNTDDFTCTTLSLLSGKEISSASGLAFNHDKNTGTTYILTAEHFCQIVEDDLELPEFLENNPDIDKESVSHDIDLILKNINGETFTAYVLSVDRDADLCLLASDDMIIDKKISLADSMPARGDSIYVTSAPHGIHSYMSSIKFSGVFSGCTNSYTCLYSIPTDYGSSGSIILNKNGKMIGMIQRMSYNFNSVSMGVGIERILEFLLLSEADLNLSLMP